MSVVYAHIRSRLHPLCTDKIEQASSVVIDMHTLPDRSLGLLVCLAFPSSLARACLAAPNPRHIAI